jgi:hypothetical protein
VQAMIQLDGPRRHDYHDGGMHSFALTVRHQRVLTSVPCKASERSAAVALVCSSSFRSYSRLRIPARCHRHDHDLVPSPGIIASALLISTPTLSTGRRCAWTVQRLFDIVTLRGLRVRHRAQFPPSSAPSFFFVLSSIVRVGAVIACSPSHRSPAVDGPPIHSIVLR